jgi:hypothetical protein
MAKKTFTVYTTPRPASSESVMDMVWSLVKMAREKRLMSVGITVSFWKERTLMHEVWHVAEKRDHYEDILDCAAMLEREVEKTILRETGE